MNLFRLSFLIPLLLASNSVLAKASVPSSGSYLLQVFFGLALVVGLIFGMAWMLRRFSPGGMMNNQHMRVISCLSLGAREKIVLLQVGEKQMLVGVTPQQINALETFDAPVVQEEIKENPDFSRRLMEIMKRGVK